MSKLSLAILFGGASSEHDISCISAKTIVDNIDKEKYDISLIGITKQGEWFLYDGEADKIPNDKWLESPNLKKPLLRPIPQ